MIFYFTEHLFEKVLTNPQAENFFEANIERCLKEVHVWAGRSALTEKGKGTTIRMKAKKHKSWKIKKAATGSLLYIIERLFFRCILRLKTELLLQNIFPYSPYRGL